MSSCLDLRRCSFPVAAPSVQPLLRGCASAAGTKARRGRGLAGWSRAPQGVSAGCASPEEVCLAYGRASAFPCGFLTLLLALLSCVTTLRVSFVNPTSFSSAYFASSSLKKIMTENWISLDPVVPCHAMY